MNIRQKFGIKIRKLRKSKGYSQEAFALLCDIDPSYMSIIERGEKAITIIKLEQISQALNITIKDLVDGIENIKR